LTYATRMDAFYKSVLKAHKIESELLCIRKRMDLAFSAVCSVICIGLSSGLRMLPYPANFVSRLENSHFSELRIKPTDFAVNRNQSITRNVPAYRYYVAFSSMSNMKKKKANIKTEAEIRCKV